MKNYSLIVSGPDAEPKLYELRGERVGLGRELDNQIRLKLNEVSSSHCEFRRLAAGGYEVVDLDSTNGTRVNGKTVESRVLADGDRLLIGEVVAVHFVELAEGESPVDVAVEAGAEGQKAAAAYSQMDKKLQAMEDDIEAKSYELEALQAEHDEKMAEYGRMAAAMKSLEEEIAKKRKASGGQDTEEIRKLEMDLLTQTRRVQVMRNRPGWSGTATPGAAGQSRCLEYTRCRPAAPLGRPTGGASADVRFPACASATRLSFLRTLKQSRQLLRLSLRFQSRSPFPKFQSLPGRNPNH